MAGGTNIDPFFVIDDSGSLQNLKVIVRDNRVLPYSLAELVSSSVAVEGFGDLTASVDAVSSSIVTASTNIVNELTASHAYLTASYNQLTESVSLLNNITHSLNVATGSLADISSSLTASNELLASISGTLTASYDYLTASYDYSTASYIQLTASYNELTQSNTNLTILSESSDRTYNYLTSSLSGVMTQLTQSVAYLKQLSAYGRATLATSSIFSVSDIGSGLDLSTKLVPQLAYIEQYLNSCVDVLIQNNTDVKCYVKIIHNPSASVSPSDYTIVLPPGVIYNSESQLASMRHVIYVTASAGTGSEVSAMMTYNTKLLDDPLQPALVLPNTIKSLAVNFYNIPDAGPAMVNEWVYSPAVENTKLVIVGQARVTNPGETLKLYITKNEIPVGTEEFITSTTPANFILEVTGATAGDYEFMADSVGGFTETGDARILFADLLIVSGSV